MENHTILWSPEEGVCSCCRRSCQTVRRFTSDGFHEIFCFPCWNGQQESFLISSQDWYDSSTLDFECISPEDGTPKIAQWN